ncbi:MAG: hypothetical protein JNL11_07760 [Bdellovibrionaceae bacterium]|nr:hypothetical protein [Pseudobdellovibrionaceae bacterium]
MLDFFSLVFTLLFSTSIFAQMIKTDELLLNKKNIEVYYGEDFRGILYSCIPYCQFVSLKEGQAWIPDLKPEIVKKTSLKIVRKTDPIYPLLIAVLPIKPYVVEAGKSAPETEVKPEAEALPPEYAVMPFNFGYSIGGGFNFSSVKTTSNTAIQSQFQSNSLFPSLKLVGNLMKGKPFGVFNLWILPEMELNLLVGSQFKTKDQTTFFHQLMEIPIYFLIPHKNFKQGPVFTISNEAYTSSFNSLSHYAFSESNYLIGWNIRYRHWLLGLHTSLTQNLKETQDFRQAPLTIDLYKLQLQKCTGIISLFDINFQACGGANYSLSKQKASLDSSLSSDGTSEITYTRTMLFTTLRIGEDLFK